MEQAFTRLYRGYGRLLEWLGLFAGMIAFALMWLIFVNAVLRKSFNSPIDGAFEITESGLVLVISFALAFTQYRRGHIRVTLITRHLPMAVQSLLNVVVYLAGFAFFAWCAYAAWDYTVRSYLIGEQEQGLLRFALWPIKGSIFLGTALLALQFLLDACRALLVLTGRLELSEADQ